MDTMFLMKYTMPVVFIGTSALFFFVALKTIVGRRPLLFSARWLFAVMCLSFLPSLFIQVNLWFTTKDSSLTTMAWMSPLMFIVFLVFMWIQMKGYFAFAISDSYFRDALLQSASNLGYTLEETMSRVKVRETGEEIQVAVQDWTGVAQLKPANSDARQTVDKIARGMNDYFSQSSGKMNFLSSYLYLIMGGAMIVVAISLFSTTSRLVQLEKSTSDIEGRQLPD
jgi:hypothetical protein